MCAHSLNAFLKLEWGKNVILHYGYCKLHFLVLTARAKWSDLFDLPDILFWKRNVENTIVQKRQGRLRHEE